MIKNFPHFYDNEAVDMMSLSSDPIVGQNPFFQQSTAWRVNRRELVPGYTSRRVKSYIPIMHNVCQKLSKYIDGLTKCKKATKIDIDDVSKLK